MHTLQPSTTDSWLCTPTPSDSSAFLQRSSEFITIPYYVLLALLLGGNGFAFSYVRRVQELEQKLANRRWPQRGARGDR
jgi:hypothetical protein